MKVYLITIEDSSGTKMTHEVSAMHVSHAFKKASEIHTGRWVLIFAIEVKF